MFARLKSDADRLAADAAGQRRERDAHALRSYGILERRIGSPPGLIACFSAGVFAGALTRRAGRPRDDGAGRRPSGHERRDAGFTERLLHGPLGAAAIRLGTAYLAGRMAQPEHAEAADPDWMPP